MLKKLNYSVSFYSTGKTLRNEISFEPGITSITGPNEAGKSTVIEMIRYALFGVSALRAAKSSYKKLEVELQLLIKNKPYHIIRKGNSASVNGAEAVGTTAVNEFILDTLGYGMSVFDISNNVPQGKLNKLTSGMGPTERKEMVDNVLGLGQFETLQKHYRVLSNDENKLYNALDDQTPEPQEPVRPDTTYNSSQLHKMLLEQLANQKLEDSFIYQEAPKLPVEPEVPLSVYRLQEIFIQDKIIRDNINSQLAALPTATHNYSRDQLDQFILYYEQESRGPRPDYLSEEQLLQWQLDHRTLAKEDDPIICQNCGEVVVGRELPDEPPISADEVSRQLSFLRAWKGYKYNPHIARPEISLDQCHLALQAIDAEPDRNSLTRQLQQLGDMPEDYSEDVAALDQYMVEMSKYEASLVYYDKYLQEEKRIKSLPNPDPELPSLYAQMVDYESKMLVYQDQIEKRDLHLKTMESVAQRRADYKNGSDALKECRHRIKQHIIPSLATVSSILLSQMTDGARSQINISEDFEIEVDGQPVNTLSGSATSVTNLALRIALGQVLTKSVLPIFLADEIDADMDAVRVNATHDSLRKLSSSLDQVIIVTHKSFEGDQTICLK